MGFTVQGVGCSAEPRGRGGFERNVQWFRGGLVSKAHIRVYHSFLGLRVTKKKKVQGVGYRVEGSGCTLESVGKGCVLKKCAVVPRWTRI